MKKFWLTLAAAPAIFMLLTAAQCATGSLFADVRLACAVEENAHMVYVSLNASGLLQRPAAAQAAEFRRYTVAHNLCVSGGTIDQINNAIAAAQSVRLPQ